MEDIEKNLKELLDNSFWAGVNYARHHKEQSGDKRHIQKAIRVESEILPARFLNKLQALKTN